MNKWLKKIFFLWNKRRLLKAIGKEINLYHEYSRNIEYQKHIVISMVRAYEKEFDESLGLNSIF